MIVGTECFLSKETAARSIVEVSRYIKNSNMLAAADGNISCRLETGEILITPTQRNKSFINENDLALMKLSGEAISGKPSSESKMHLEIYNQCPLAKFVIHAHPIASIAWSVAYPDDLELPIGSLSEVILGVGKIPILAYQRPGTSDLAKEVGLCAAVSRIMILARHGAVGWGETPEEAINGMERCEHTALVLTKAVMMNQISSLPEEEILYLKKVRENANGKSL